MQSGTLTVTGNSSTRILLQGFPREVNVHFVEMDPVPCNPHHHHHEHDHLHYIVEKVDEDPRHHHEPGHHHHDRQFYLVISWRVAEVREIVWHVHY